MAVKTCKSCGEVNKESAHVCIVCSRSLKDVVLEGTLESEKKYDESLLIAKKSSTICRHCSEENEQNALQCKYCGTFISRAKSPSTYYASRYEQNSPDGCAVALLFIATFFIPLVGLFVGGIYSFSEDGNKQDIGKMLLIFGLVIIVFEIVLVFTLL